MKHLCPVCRGCMGVHQAETGGKELELELDLELDRA